MKTILVTGTPGTGKSLLCAQLTLALGEKGHRVLPLSVGDLIKRAGLYDEYDARLDTLLIDERRVRKHLQAFLGTHSVEHDFCVMETHTVSAVPREAVSLVVVLTCRTEVLYDRLRARGYGKAKLEENMECEIMRIVLEEAHARFAQRTILELASNTTEDLQDNLESILEGVEGDRS